MSWHSSDSLVVSRGTSPDVTKKIPQRVVLSLVANIANSNKRITSTDGGGLKVDH